MPENSHKFFKNAQCKYFPCHSNCEPQDLNCMFCYCPLYLLGSKCGGGFKYKGQVKDCSDCILPHVPENYELIIQKLKENATKTGL